jgi:hypothetical protein
MPQDSAEVVSALAGVLLSDFGGVYHQQDVYSLRQSQGTE